MSAEVAISKKKTKNRQQQQQRQWRWRKLTLVTYSSGGHCLSSGWTLAGRVGVGDSCRCFGSGGLLVEQDLQSRYPSNLEAWWHSLMPLHRASAYTPCSTSVSVLGSWHTFLLSLVRYLCHLYQYNIQGTPCIINTTLLVK